MKKWLSGKLDKGVCMENNVQEKRNDKQETGPEIDHAWLCVCGHYQGDNFPCSCCGAQPPAGWEPPANWDEYEL